MLVRHICSMLLWHSGRSENLVVCSALCSLTIMYIHTSPLTPANVLHNTACRRLLCLSINSFVMPLLLLSDPSAFCCDSLAIVTYADLF